MFEDSEKLSRSDMRLIEMAARNHWSVSPTDRDALTTWLAMIVADLNQRPLTQIAAARAATCP